MTSGVFTEDAQSFAKGRNIELMDGRALTEMIGKVRAGRPIPPPETGTPTCPHCGSVMVKRMAKQGPNAGKAFWGCPKFPKCRGMKAIE